MPIPTIIDELSNAIDLPMAELIVYLIGVVAVFIILFIVYAIINFILKKIDKQNKHDFTDRMRRNLKLPVITLMAIFALWTPLSFIDPSDKVTRLANKSLTILLIIIFSWMIIRAIHMIKHYVLKKYDVSQKDNLKARKIYTQFRIIERVLVFLIIVIAVALILMSFNQIRKIGISLIASAGLTGIILGLAAQKVLGGVLAGIQIALTQPIRLDDVVIVENEWGWIEEINLTYVVVKIWDERRLVLPSTYFIEKPFQNWTRTNSRLLGTVFLYTDYQVSVDAIREEQTRLLENTNLWDKRVNVVQVTNTTEKSIEIRCLVSSVDSPTGWDLRVYLREGLVKFLQENYPESLPRSRVAIMEEKDEQNDTTNELKV